jgi:DNA-binding Lrp family transcriptional regulator
MPVSELARQIGVSRTTVQDRLKRLEDSGTIAGYGVRLGESSGLSGIQALVSVSVEPRKTNDVVRALVENAVGADAAFGIRQVRCRRVAACPDHERIDELLDDIGLIDGVNDTESSIILATKLDRR